MGDIIFQNAPQYESFWISLMSGHLVDWLQHQLQNLNILSGIDFSLLYNWTPIGAACSAVIAFSIFMFILGLIKKLPLL